jgi:DNA repair protein RadC
MLIVLADYAVSRPPLVLCEDAPLSQGGHPQYEPRKMAMRHREMHLGRLVSYLRAAVLSGADQRERAHVLYSDAAQRYLGEAAVGAGSIASLVLDPREILATGFSLGARGMILAHNHPSGDCRPSRADLIATRRLSLLGQAVDLPLLDHLIITSASAYSMRAGGLI